MDEQTRLIKEALDSYREEYDFLYDENKTKAILDAMSEIGCTSFRFSASEMKEILEKQNKRDFTQPFKSMSEEELCTLTHSTLDEMGIDYQDVTQTENKEEK